MNPISKFRCNNVTGTKYTYDCRCIAIAAPSARFSRAIHKVLKKSTAMLSGKKEITRLQAVNRILPDLQLL